MNQLTSEKKQKLLEVIYKGDLESIAKFAHDTTYLNACLSDVNYLCIYNHEARINFSSFRL